MPPRSGQAKALQKGEKVPSTQMENIKRIKMEDSKPFQTSAMKARMTARTQTI